MTLRHDEVLLVYDQNEYLGPGETRRPGLQWRLVCPECGDGGVEQMGPGGGDEAAVTVHPDRDAHDSPIGTRGGYVQVQLFCPDGHGFDLIIANHKGAEFVAVVPAGYRDYLTAAGYPEDYAPPA